MAAGLAGLPPSLKVIQPYLKVAKEYEKRDPIVAYYCEYTVQASTMIVLVVF